MDAYLNLLKGKRTNKIKELKDNLKKREELQNKITELKNQRFKLQKNELDKDNENKMFNKQYNILYNANKEKKDKIKQDLREVKKTNKILLEEFQKLQVNIRHEMDFFRKEITKDLKPLSSMIISKFSINKNI